MLSHPQRRLRRLIAPALILAAIFWAAPVQGATPTSTPWPTATPTSAQVEAAQTTPTPRPIAPARAAATALATLTPPSPDLPEATTLVDGLSLHLGPDVNFPEVTRVESGALLRVTGENNNCTWLRVMTDEGVAGWIDANPRDIALNAPCSAVPNALSMALRGATTAAPETTAPRATASATPAPTATRTPTRTPTVTPTPTPSASPLPPLGMGPRVAPPTATPRPRPRATATARGAAPLLPALPTPTPNLLAAAAVGGPNSVSILGPPAGLTSRNREEFDWVADAELVPGQVFEVAFWLPGQGPVEGVGWTGATIGNSISAKLYEQPPGDYYWGVWLGAYIDGAYHRLRYLGGGLPFEVAREPAPTAAPIQDGGGGGGGGGEPEPQPTEDPGGNCPPDAPCKP